MEEVSLRAAAVLCLSCVMSCLVVCVCVCVYVFAGGGSGFSVHATGRDVHRRGGGVSLFDTFVAVDYSPCVDLIGFCIINHQSITLSENDLIASGMF